MENFKGYIEEKLVEILNIPSPSGDTALAMKKFAQEVENLGLKSQFTQKGAVRVVVPGKRKESKIIAAHMDTLGAMVREITPNGGLRLTQIGGYPWSAVDGEYCTISTFDKGEVRGTIIFERFAVHTFGDAGRTEARTGDNMIVRIDELVSTKKEVQDLGISVGDFVYLDPRVEVTKSGFIKSRHLDNKAAVAIILGTLKYIVENNITPEYTLDFFISNYEEVGHGAAGITNETTVEILAIDMSCPGAGQESKEDKVTICAKDSSGPYDLEMRRRLQTLGEENKIDYVIDTYKHYGSDASALLRSGAQVKHGLVGPGIDASHSYERTHINGIMETFKLVVAYIK